MAFALRQKVINGSSACPICLCSFKQITTIDGCCHRFCFNCIKKKITEEGLRSCPVCKVDLGSDPLQKLRYSEASDEPVITSKDVITSKGEEDDTHAHSRNEKQKYLAEGSSSSNLNVPKSTSEDAMPKSQEKVSDLSEPQMGSGKSTVVMADDKKAGHNKKVESFWFALVASDKQKTKEPLKQIPSRYLRVKDGSITVSCIKKYLVQKLNLSSENEVEISLQGRQLPPTFQIHKLLDLWLHTTTPSKTKRAYVGCSAKDFVLTLTYSRKA